MLGLSVSTLIAKIRTELSDTGASPRWADSVLLSYLNDALRDLAEACVFRRTDIVVPTADGMVYAPHMEPVRYFGVSHSGVPLAAKSEADLYALAGSGWAGMGGPPTHYVPGEAIRVWPKPGAGTALTFPVPPPITEAEGKGPGGAGYTSALNGSLLVHWLPGDGTVGNENAPGNITIDYAYFPSEVMSTDRLSRRYASAVMQYAVGTALEKSEDTGEQRARDRALLRYYESKQALADAQNAGRLSAEYLPAKQCEPALGKWDILSDTGPYR